MHPVGATTSRPLYVAITRTFSPVLTRAAPAHDCEPQIVASIQHHQDILSLAKLLIKPIADHVFITQELLGGIAYLVCVLYASSPSSPYVIAMCPHAIPHAIVLA